MGATQVAAEVGGKVPHGRVPIHRALGEALQRDRFERLGDVDAEAARALRRLIDVLAGDLHRRVADERRAAGHHLVEDHGKRVDVAARSDLLSLRLLGREVRGGAEHGAAFGGHVGLGAGGERLGDAEVGQLHLTVGGDEHVARLHVHVDHALTMGGIERSGHVDGDLGGPVRVEAALVAEHVGKAAAVHVLHDDERGAVFLALIEHADDVLMVEAGDELRLPAESFDEGLVLGQFGAEDLDRHRAVQQLVAREVDIGRAAGGKLTMQFVSAREDLVGRVRHNRNRLQTDCEERRSRRRIGQRAAAHAAMTA